MACCLAWLLTGSRSHELWHTSYQPLLETFCRRHPERHCAALRAHTALLHQSAHLAEYVEADGETERDASRTHNGGHGSSQDRDETQSGGLVREGLSLNGIQNSSAALIHAG